MRAARIDATHAAIVLALRGCGATVQSLATVGAGCPDAVVGWKGANLLLEIKADRGQLTPAQVAWHAHWRGQVAIVRTVDEALAILGVREMARVAPIRAIPTWIRGHHMRSRLEARWAVYFDALQLTWEYEPEGYVLPDGTCYLPDFWLPQVRMYAEVKPSDVRDEVVISAEEQRKAIWLARASRRPVILCDGVPRNTNYWTAWPEDGEDWTWEDVHFCDENRYHLTEGRLFTATGAGLFRHCPSEVEPWSPWYDLHPAVVAARSARFERIA